MAKYRVTGADRESGEEVELLIDAQNSEEAKAKANRRGILVAGFAVVGNGEGHVRGRHEPVHYEGQRRQAVAEAPVGAGTTTGTQPQSIPVGVASARRTKSKLVRVNMVLIPVALILVLAAVLVPRRSGWTGVPDAGGDGPVYKGKTAAEWAKACDDRDERTKMDALTAMAEIGPEMGPKM